MPPNQGERIAAMEVSLRDNTSRLTDLSDDLQNKHKENRQSIHALRNSIQVVVNQMAVDQLSLQEKMHIRDVQIIRTQAKWAGMATAAAFILTLLAPFAQEALKHLFAH